MQNYIKSFGISALLVMLLNIPLLAQELNEGGKPNRFIPYGISELINSAYNEINPVFSPDGNTLYFSRVDHPSNHYGEFRSQDIWYSELEYDGKWTEPKRLEATFNNHRYNAIYAITEDGKFLISGIYNKKGKYKGRGLSYVTQTQDGWSTPTKLKIPKIHKQDKGLTTSVFLDEKDNVLITCYSSSWQSTFTKMRVSTKKNSGKWTKPKAIKNKSLTKQLRSIESPYFSVEDNTVYFSAYKKARGQYYKNDIYSLTKKGDSFKSWSNFKKVDNVVNSNKWENYYKLFNEENWAIFTRAAVGDDSDIFLVKLFEPRPYVDVHGVVNQDGKPYKGDFSIMINGSVVDSVRINKDSSTYAVQLPLGKKYELQAKASEMEATIEVIDAEYDMEYRKENRDLSLSLLPFLDLAGTVTLYDVPFTEPFEVLVNGGLVDSLIVDQETGRYAVQLPLGDKYTIEARSGNYIPNSEEVDVTVDTKQVRVERDLKLTAIPYVDISGKVLDRSSDDMLPLQTEPHLLINGVNVDSISISESGYKIRLPWGKRYVLSVEAKEYGGQAAVIDLTQVRNYKKIDQDLYAIPLQKYALVRGKVLNMKTGMPIKNGYIIEVNGVASTNSKINTDGSYELKIPLGTKIILTANAVKFFPISELIDLVGKTENIELQQDLQLMPLEVGEKILLNNIFFETGSTNLKSESFADIDRVVELLRAVPSLKIEISGYTDSSGRDEFNLGLSNSRARSVADYILSKGIDKSRVLHKGYGEANPVATNLTPEGRAKNRRVEFVVLEQ